MKIYVSITPPSESPEPVNYNIMTYIIPKENRIKELLNFGLPKIFIENIGNLEELKYRVEDVDNAYFYLPTILDYEILNGKRIVPIFSCGESFMVLILDNETEKIIYFELENDQVYKDYGRNIDLMLMDIMINYFDDHIDDEIVLGKYISIGERIGFEKSKELFQLRNLSIDDYNSKAENIENWRIEIAKELKIL
ncbi:hypothetical protein [Chryseobacterium luteum]|uniref:Uncharacterized protein n=1 Tax=Chryseobacterium luteum TaxID=421531 RepID=A0A085YZL2_9FLAO|nr:hypothetical protein [Chryseobacterium luteum]KFE97625.1 hypothetical protein IX38_20375 [Chryseobacterium luteum]